MPEIRCSVANCTHWGDGNYCRASSIIIQNDRSPEDSASQSFQNALLSGELHDTASTSSDTCCKTFEPKY